MSEGRLQHKMEVLWSDTDEYMRDALSSLERLVLWVNLGYEL